MTADIKPFPNVVFGMLAVMFVFGLSLLLWSLVFDKGDWAFVALLPLFFMVYRGCYHVSLRRRKAILLAALRSDSYLARIMKGRIISFAFSFAIAIVATLVLAFEAINTSIPELLVLIVLCFLALSLYKFFSLQLLSQLNDSFLPAFSTRLSVLVAGLLMSPVYAWVEFNYVTHPGYFRELSLVDALRETLEQSAVAGNLTNELLSTFYTLDSTKLWLAANADSQDWVSVQLLPVAYVVFDAAICFLVARAVIAIAAFFQFSLRNWRY